MDPISALSLAANIFQVIGFTNDFISVAKQIYEAGSTADQYAIEQIASHALATADDITADIRGREPAPEDSADGALLKLGDEAVSIAGELKLLLQKLRGKGEGGKPWKTLHQALVTIWKKGDIEKLEKRLVAVRDELQFHAVVQIQKKLNEQNLRVEDVVGKLDQQAQAVVPRLFNQFEEIKLQNETIIERQSRGEAEARDRHEELMGFVNSFHPHKSLPKGHTQASQETIKYIQDSFLLSLWFPALQDREDTIHEAYQKTYGWLFCDPVKEQKPWASFRDFLLNDGDIYWITGKPGSGKSTLTKFAVQHRQTKQALSQWARRKDPIVASFYFYYKGTKMQKSKMGVLRAILHQILYQRRDLIEAAFPQRYQASLLQQTGGTFEPTYLELKRALEGLLESCQEERFFIVVDGLDEYDAGRAQMGELVDVFIRLSKFPNAKFLLTSRPWVVFEERFTGYPRLRLHELTRPDIKMYVNEQIERHPRAQHMIEDQKSAIHDLREEIVEHSSGVFLWVYLVVRSLLDGLSSGDSIDELRDYFLELPTELEDLYLHMWSLIPERYQPQVSRLLQILAAGTSAGARTSLLGLALAEELDETAPFTIPVSPLADEEAHERMKSMELRIASRCLGLVEVHRVEEIKTDMLSPSLDSDCYPNTIENEVGNPFVSFIHRTVFEFVSEPEYGGKLEAAAARGSKEGFIAECALLRLLVLRIKTFSHDKLNSDVPSGSLIPPSLESLVYYALRTCRRAEIVSGKAQTRLMTELDKTMTHLYENVYNCSGMGHWHNGLRFQGDVGESELLEASRLVWKRNDMLSLAVRHGLALFVKESPSIAEFAKSKPGRPLLDYALRPGCKVLGSEQQMVLDRSSAIVELLLSNGARPGQTFGGKSLFKHFIDDLGKDQLSRYKAMVETPKTVIVLLEHMSPSDAEADDLQALHRLLVQMIPQDEERAHSKTDMQEVEVNIERAFVALNRFHSAPLTGNKSASHCGQSIGLDHVDNGLVDMSISSNSAPPSKSPGDPIETRKPAMKRKLLDRLKDTFRKT